MDCTFSIKVCKNIGGLPILGVQNPWFMEQNALENLSEEELIEAQKKLKSGKVIDSVLIGVFLGIAIYSAVKNGFGFATILPLFFVFLFIRKSRKMEAIVAELASRRAE